MTHYHLWVTGRAGHGSQVTKYNPLSYRAKMFSVSIVAAHLIVMLTLCQPTVVYLVFSPSTCDWRACLALPILQLVQCFLKVSFCEPGLTSGRRHHVRLANWSCNAHTVHRRIAEFRAQVKTTSLSSSEDRVILAWVILTWYRTMTDRRTNG